MPLLVYKNKIGSIHVIKIKKLVGFISVLDMLALFIYLMGIFHTGSRLDIISVGMPLYAKNKKSKSISFASIFAKQPPLVNIIEKAGFRVLNFID
jgi:hypothetical protein